MHTSRRHQVYVRRSRLMATLRLLASVVAALDCIITARLNLAPLHRSALRIGRALRAQWRRLRWQHATGRRALAQPVLRGRVVVHRPTSVEEE